MDIEQPGELVHYLRDRNQLSVDESVDVHCLAGGVSNRTMLVRRQQKPDWVVKQALKKLRVAADWYSDPSRIHREALGLRVLERILPPGVTPQFLFEDSAEHLLGMTAIPEPHENWKSLLLAGQVDLMLIEQSARLLAAMHVGSSQVSAIDRHKLEDRSFFEELRLEPYYQFAAEQVPQSQQFLGEQLAETRRRQQTIVHGDYSPKNILVTNGQLVLLDFEVIHWGDPSFDCGFFLTHLFSKAHHFPASRARLIDAATLWFQTYLAATARQPWAEDLESRIVRQTLACLLARVRGRSPLEYLDENERTRQANAILMIVTDACYKFDGLCHRFLKNIAT